MKIAFDLDGTLCDTVSILREFIFSKYHHDIYPINQYRIQIPNKTDEETSLIIKEIISKYNKAILPYREVPNCIYRAYKYFNNRPITIITARERSLFDKTEEWAFDNFYVKYNVYCNVIFAKGVEKKNYLIKNKFTHWIDDNADDINLICDSNIKGFLINRTWNMNTNICENAVRVNTLNDVCRILEIK